MATDTKSGVFQLIPIEQIVPSKTNPRKTFDKAKLGELTASIAAKGVIEPVLVRPQNGHFEIVTGERRLRASRAAQKTTLPAVVRELTDEQVLEIQLEENLQRDDLHPLEEAEGYEKLRKLFKHETQAIAQRIGKDAHYVARRLSLLTLIEPARKAFLADRIFIGHAELLSRLQPEQQSQAIKQVFEKQWIDQDRDIPGQALVNEPKQRQIETVRSVKQLDQWIKVNILLDLSSAPFKKDDAKLLPKAGSCLTCPKRTGNQPGLFPDLKKGDVCTDPGCFRSKCEAQTARTEADIRKAQGSVIYVSREYYADQKGVLTKGDFRAATKEEVKKGKAKKAIVAEGGDRGQVVDIVILKKETGGGGSAQGEARANAARAAARRTKKEAYRRQLVMGALVSKFTRTLTIEQYRRVVGKFFACIGADSQIALMRSLGFEREKGQASYHQEGPFEKKVLSKVKSEIGMHGLLYAISLSGQLHPDAYGASSATDLLEAAKTFKVDLKAVQKQVETKFPDARKRQKKVKTSKKPLTQKATKKETKTGGKRR